MTDPAVTDKGAPAAKDVADAAREIEKKVEKRVEKAADGVTDTARTAKGKAVAAVDDDSAAKPAAPPQRSLDEIEADLDVTRTRLAGRLEDLAAYISPKNVAQRQLAKAKGVFVDEYGGIKPDRVLVVAGVVVAIVGIGVLRRRRRG